MGYDTDIKISLEGREELNAIINRVDKKVRKKLLIKVFRQSAKPLVKEAKRLAPKSHKKSYIVAQFQFQYGSIKRTLQAGTAVTGTVFQFQYGSIKSTNAIKSGNVVEIFQFQYGSIKRIKSKVKTAIVSNISIPIWFD